MECFRGRAWAEIDFDAMRFNIESIKKAIRKDTKIIAVIKADAYGHGALQTASMLEREERVWGYAVATGQEALALCMNQVKKPVLILGYAFPEDYGLLLENDVRPAVYMYDAAKALSEKAVEMGKICKVHIKIDTGMARIGIVPDADGLALIRRIAQLPGLEIEGIFTHFASSDEEDTAKAYRQLKIFQEFAAKAEAALDMRIPMKHCANSAAIARMPEADMNAVRAGIILYGLWPSAEVKAEGRIRLKPVLSLRAAVIYVKTVPKGQEISYGGTFTTARETKVATISIGYGDGYPRSLSNAGYVLVKGKRAPVIGRVCMDQLMVDVTDIGDELQVGDVVTLIGADGEECITLEELGERSGRFNYEFACGLSGRIMRVYLPDMEQL